MFSPFLWFAELRVETAACDDTQPLYEVWFFIWKSLCLLQGSRTHGFPLKSYTHFRILLLKSLLSLYR